MNNNIVVRSANSTDMIDIHRLVMELAIFEKEPEAVKIDATYYTDQFEKGLFQAIVAEIAGEIIGTMVFYPTFSTWKGKMMYLEDFVVTEQYRNKGIGQILWNAFIKVSKEQDCKLLKWQILDWNTSAVQFYEKNGATIEKEWWNGKLFL